MTTEEKARAYDEILAKAKEFNLQGYIDEECLYDMFPQLMESDNERIRKVLIDYFKRYKENEEFGINTFYGISTDDILAWLEKQGEKDNTIDIDKIVDDFSKTKIKCYPSGIEVIPSMIEVDAYRKGLNDALRLVLNVEKQGKQKPADKVEPKFKVGDWITIKE